MADETIIRSGILDDDITPPRRSARAKEAHSCVYGLPGTFRHFRASSTMLTAPERELRHGHLDASWSFFACRHQRLANGHC